MSTTAPFAKTWAAANYMSPVGQTLFSSQIETLTLLQLLGNDLSAKALIRSVNRSPYTKAVRRVYATALLCNCLRPAIPKLQGVMDKMIEVIEAKRQRGPVDFQKLCVRMTLDAIGVVALGANLGGLDGSSHMYDLLVAASHITFSLAADPFRAFLYKRLPSLKGVQEMKATIDAMTAEWDALTREILTREDPPAGEKPIWHLLRTMIDPETGRMIDYKSLLSEVASVVAAGTDSTGHQLSHILALLASHPDVVEKLIEELKKHGLYGPGCKPVTSEDFSDLTYLAAIVKEGMRVSHVVVHIFDREVPKDMKILGYRVPKGTIVALPANRWINSETEWGDPDVFRPERWLTGEDMSQKY